LGHVLQNKNMPKKNFSQNLLQHFSPCNSYPVSGISTNIDRYLFNAFNFWLSEQAECS
jgi:hypothetical protein